MSLNEYSEIDENMNSDERYMALALEEARKAAAIGEVPIGAVVVCDGRVVARAFNRREIDHDPAGHAEHAAILKAARRLGRWRLSDCTVYVTLEPCPMCAGLMHQARIKRCVFAAYDPKAGALGSLYDLHDDERLNHRFEIETGVLQEESSRLLKEFFRDLRGREKKPAVFENIRPGSQEEVAKRPAWMKAPSLAEATLTSDVAYKGRIFNVEELTVRLPDGKTGRRDVVRHQGAAAILAINENDEVLLVNQWRSALGRVECEIPAGKIDPGENPRDCAVRELAEETGISAGRFEYLTTVDTSAGFCDEGLHIYVARDLEQGATNRDEDEFLEMQWVDFEEALDSCLNGQIQDSKTIIALSVWGHKRCRG
ncbi:MAG: NUDIX domain-containing protein [Coriobacteriia bacterium]|nr:NUDIX domain-containing protein [Coriobacteriia bacterium]